MNSPCFAQMTVIELYAPSNTDLEKSNWSSWWCLDLIVRQNFSPAMRRLEATEATTAVVQELSSVIKRSLKDSGSLIERLTSSVNQTKKEGGPKPPFL